MRINKKWLIKNNACEKGCEWFLAQAETDGVAVVKKLMTEKHFGWANWTI